MLIVYWTIFSPLFRTIVGNFELLSSLSIAYVRRCCYTYYIHEPSTALFCSTLVYSAPVYSTFSVSVWRFGIVITSLAMSGNKIYAYRTSVGERMHAMSFNMLWYSFTFDFTCICDRTTVALFMIFLRDVSNVNAWGIQVDLNFSTQINGWRHYFGYILLQSLWIKH